MDREKVKNRGFLYQKYIVEDMTCREISKLTGISDDTIFNWLVKFGVPRRRPATRKGFKYDEAHSQRQSERQKGDKSTTWKGGKFQSCGYIFIFKPGHPNSDKRGYIREHRLVMSNHLGRPLNSKDRIHHKDRNRSNNVIENLQLCTFVEHMKIHKDVIKKAKEGILKWKEKSAL